MENFTVWTETKGLMVHDDSSCKSPNAPRDYNDYFHMELGYHEAYYANGIMHWRCRNCGYLWHHEPYGPVIRTEQTENKQVVYK